MNLCYLSIAQCNFEVTPLSSIPPVYTNISKCNDTHMNILRKTRELHKPTTATVVHCDLSYSGSGFTVMDHKGHIILTTHTHRSFSFYTRIFSAHFFSLNPFAKKLDFYYFICFCLFQALLLSNYSFHFQPSLF